MQSNIIHAIKNGIVPIFPTGNAQKREIFHVFGELPSDVPNEDDQINFRGLITGGILCSSIKTFKYRVHSSSASSWLRSGYPDTDYLNRFKEDMIHRKRHMHYWGLCLNKRFINNMELLQNRLALKMELFGSLAIIDILKFRERLACIILYQKVLIKKEFLYFLLGSRGVLLWRRIRYVFGRI